MLVLSALIERSFSWDPSTDIYRYEEWETILTHLSVPIWYPGLRLLLHPHKTSNAGDRMKTDWDITSCLNEEKMQQRVEEKRRNAESLHGFQSQPTPTAAPDFPLCNLTQQILNLSCLESKHLLARICSREC